MKKIARILLATAALFAAFSCVKEVPQDNGSVVLTAYVDNGVETRTQLDGVDIIWSATDQVWATQNFSALLKSTATEVFDGGAGAKFTFGTAPESFVPVAAVYPAAEGVTIGEEAVVVTIPAEQEAVAGSFADGANVAAAVNITDIDNVQFKNLGGLICVMIKGAERDVKSFTVEGTPASGTLNTLTGGQIVTYSGTEFTGWSAYDETGVNSVTVAGADALKANAKYYAVVAPGTYENVKITFTDAAGNTASYTKKTPLVVERNSNQLIGAFTIPENKWEGGNEEEYYVKITSDDEIMAGDYLIVYESLNNDAEEEAEILSGVASNLGTVATAPIITEDGVKKIASRGNGDYKIVVEEASSGTYTMKLGDGYLAYNKPAGTTKNNYLYLVETATEDGTEWTLTADAVINAFNPERYLQYNYNQGNARFACYLGTMNNVCLYLREGSGHTSGKLPAGLAFTTTSYELTLGDDFEAPALTNPNNLPVTYSSDPATVATVDASTGEVEILTAGVVTITATFEGNETYYDGSASYTITVNAAPTSLTLPFAESFTASDGTMGWSGSVANGTIAYDNEGWEAENAYGAEGAARFGKSSNGLGKATTPAIYYSGNATITFKAGAWNGGSESTNLKLSVSSGAIYKDYELSVTTSSVTMVKGAWTEYTLYLKDLASPFTLTFEGNAASNARFFLDEISIVEGIVEPAPEFGASLTNTENVSSAGGTKTINVTGNVAWTVSATNGATVSPESGDGVGAITVTIPENTSTQNTVSYVVTVSTSAEVTPNSYEFTIVQNEATTIVNTSTEANPYTPAEAVDLAGQLDANATVEDVYVSGIISKITTAYNSTYKNISFDISADGTTEGAQFRIYRASASSADAFVVGDAVEFKGVLTNYNGTTPEMVQEGQVLIAQLKAPVISPNGGTFSDSQSVTISAAEGATVYYTVDESAPTTGSSVYSAALNLTETTTVKAIAAKGILTTGIVSAKFTKTAGGGVIEFDLGSATTGGTGTSYVTTATAFTVDEVGFVVNNWNPSSGQVRGNQGNATSISANNFQLYNTTAIPGKIRSITFESTNVIATYTFAAFGSSALSSVSTSDTNPSSVTGGLEWTVSGDNTFFYIGMAKGATSGTAKITKVTIVYE